MTDTTYRPARKRIIISNNQDNKSYLQTSGLVRREINFAEFPWIKEENVTEDIINKYQKTPKLPFNFPWMNYKLMKIEKI